MENKTSLSQPAVSVIVPNYNHEQFLRKRMQSVLHQTISNIECIILDDASTDKSTEIIKDYIQVDDRISYQPSIANSGSTFSQWNKGVQLCKSNFVWMAESDDAASPELLEELLLPFKKDSEVVLAYCQSHKMNENGSVTGSWKDFTDDLNEALFKNDFVMEGREYIERFLIHKNTIPNASAVLFRKDIYNKVGGAPEQLKTNGDWLTWLKMLCYGKVAFVAKPMNYFRHHRHSVIATMHQATSSEKYKEQFDYTMRKAFKSFCLEEKIKLSSNAVKKNHYFMALDKGNEGLFLLRGGQIGKGWKKILAASFFPIPQSGFIKKAIHYK